MKNILTLILCVLLSSQTVIAQRYKADQIRSDAEQYFPEAVSELRELLRIPNNGRIPGNILANLQWMEKRFRRLGFVTETLYSEGVPHLLVQKQVDKKLPSVLFYMQVDGQPVDSSEWDQASPYEPALKSDGSSGFTELDWNSVTRYDPDMRIYARSASDSKGPAMAFISALQILKDRKIAPAYNIKAILDFQEELGSPTLPPLVKVEREMFSAELMLIMDGTRHVSNLPTLTFGARGIATITLKVFGARDNLHSGQYGNFAPNPVFGLSRLLAGMKDEDGRVLIPGFYTGIELNERVRDIIRIEGENVQDIVSDLGIAEAEKVGNTYQEALQYPSLNIRGIKAAWVGDDVRTIIPSEAVAEIDMRLVPESDGEVWVAMVREYILSCGYYLIDGNEPTDQERKYHGKLASFSYRLGSLPFKTDMDSEVGDWLSVSMERIFGSGFVKMQMTGGSQPIAPFVKTLDIPAVSIRIPNPDNSIHAPNENLRLGNYLEGIEMCLSILTQPLH